MCKKQQQGQHHVDAEPLDVDSRFTVNRAQLKCYVILRKATQQWLCQKGHVRLMESLAQQPCDMIFLFASIGFVCSCPAMASGNVLGVSRRLADVEEGSGCM